MPTDRPPKAASARMRRAAASGGNGRSTTFSRPPWRMTRRNEVSDREPLIGSGVEPHRRSGRPSTATPRRRPGADGGRRHEVGRPRPAEADAEAGTGDLERPDRDVDDLGDLLAVLPALDQVPDLLDPLGVNLSRRPDFDGNSTNVIFSLLIAAWIDRPFETFQVVDIGALLA